MSGNPQTSAITLVFLKIARLAVMNRAIRRVAAGRQLSGGKRLCQDGNPWRKQRYNGN
jgi:hypothetical protein